MRHKSDSVSRATSKGPNIHHNPVHATPFLSSTTCGSVYLVRPSRGTSLRYCRLETSDMQARASCVLAKARTGPRRYGERDTAIRSSPTSEQGATHVFPPVRNEIFRERFRRTRTAAVAACTRAEQAARAVAITYNATLRQLVAAVRRVHVRGTKISMGYEKYVRYHRVDVDGVLPSYR